MQKRRLGRTGLQVSVIGFGGIPIISASRSEAEDVVKYAFERGINYFDTARNYGDSEEKIGSSLSDVRDEIVLASKVLQRTKRDAARAGLKQTLRNLQTDRIDLMQLHGIDNDEVLRKVMAEDGAMAALKEAKTQGQIDFIGVTGHNPHILAKAIGTREFDTVLVPLNILDRYATENLFSLANELDVGVVIMKALGGCGGPLEFVQREARIMGRPERDWPDMSEFVAHFGNVGLERAQRSLRFVLAHGIDTVIPGFRTRDEVDFALNVADHFDALTIQEKNAYRFGELPPEPFCTECGTCTPCPDGVEIPTILRWSTYSTFYGIHNWTKNQYPKLRTKANSCTKCGECEKKCPYHLPVMDMLSRAENILA